ncbi:hypothetical protein FF2_022343 [Malus domestica]
MRGADELVTVAVLSRSRLLADSERICRVFWRQSTTGSHPRPPSFVVEKESSPDFVNSRPKMEPWLRERTRS